MNILSVKNFIATAGVLGILAFSVALPVFATHVVGHAAVETAINKAILGPDSETKNLLDKFEPRGYAEIVQPGTLAYNIIATVLGFLGIACAVMMMYGGFLWITAAGEEDKAKKGSTILFQSVVGAIIIFAAYTVTYFVLVQIGKAVIK